MTTETKRDLAADLAICEAASDGIDMCVGETEVYYEYWQPGLPDEQQHPIMARFVKTEDALLFVEAREGWPHAIRRAMAAETALAEETRMTHRLVKAAEYAWENVRKAEEEVTRQKESYRKLHAVHDEQCARSAEYYAEIQRLQAFIQSESEGAIDVIAQLEASKASALHMQWAAEQAIAEVERLRDHLMTVYQKARNDCARWDGGQCVGTPVFQDRAFARRLVRDLEPILFPEVPADE